MDRTESVSQPEANPVKTDETEDANEPKAKRVKTDETDETDTASEPKAKTAEPMRPLGYCIKDNIKYDKMDIDIDMYGYPTGNPSWVGSVMNNATGKKLFDMSFQRPFATPYTGDIYEELAREDNWEHCDITPCEDIADSLPAVSAVIQEKSYNSAYILLEQCKTFYPNIKCRNLAMEMMKSGFTYHALVMIMSEIPAKTPWSTNKSMGYDDGSGFAWHAPTLSHTWNMRVGYPIMLEALKRMVDNMVN